MAYQKRILVLSLEESDLLMLTLAFNWFDERIEDLPV